MLQEEGSYPLIEPSDDFHDCADRLAASGADEFAFFPFIDPDAVERAALGRFMPMGLSLELDGRRRDLFLPKLHLERCLLDPRDTRVTATARRESRRYSLSVNRAFGTVLSSCVAIHGADWLVGDLTRAFMALHAQRYSRRVAFVSVELWAADEGGPDPVAGEIGYAVGGAYASLTGYTARSGAGTVQLAALGGLLAKLGVRVWDLGMAMDYKLALGGRALPRELFLTELDGAYRDDGEPGNAALRAVSGFVPARALLDASAPLPEGFLADSTNLADTGDHHE